MENNFIQIFASVGHDRSNFLSTLSIMCNCISPMASRILSFRASIVSGLSALHLSWTAPHFCEQKFVQHGAITVAIDCNGLSMLIFEEKLPNSASGPKSTTNSGPFWVRRLFNVCSRVFCAPNATILLVYIPVKVKMSFIWKDDFFFRQNRICKSIAGTPSEAYTRLYTTIFVRRKYKTNYLSNQPWAKCYHSRNNH